jgi:DNA-directed RNA polymerase specialized sigma subunit
MVENSEAIMPDKQEMTDNPFPSRLTEKKQVSVPEEYMTWKQSPTKNNLGPLMKKLDPVIDKALKSYGGSAADSLKARARLMTVDYLNSYDPSKGMALSSYLHQNLKSLNREKAKRSYTVHIPENVLLQKNKLYQATKTFESENGREPNVDELSDITGIPRKAIERSRGYKGTVAASTATTEKGDNLYSSTKDYEQIWSDYVYHDLDPVDKKIFEWSTGYSGSKIIPKGEMARKLGITPAAVSLRVNKIVKKLEDGHAS